MAGNNGSGFSGKVNGRNLTGQHRQARIQHIRRQGAMPNSHLQKQSKNERVEHHHHPGFSCGGCGEGCGGGNKMMTMRTYLILILSILAGQLSAQTDFYDQLKTDYDRLRKEEKHDSALTVAKQMNAWALKNETDTSLRYAVSFKYVGNCFYKLLLGDSALFYWDTSLALLAVQGRSESEDAANCYRNKAVFYDDKHDFERTRLNYEIAAEIIKKVLGEDHPDYAKSLNNLGILYY